MTLQEFEILYKDICSQIAGYKLREAFDSIRHVTSDPLLNEFSPAAEALEQRYFYMLRLIGTSSPFPGAEGEMKALSDEMTKLMSGIDRAFRIANDPDIYYARLRFQKRRPEETLESLFADYIDEQKRLATDPAALTDTRRRARLEQLASDIFMNVWTASGFGSDLADTMAAMLADHDIPAYDRELWIAAIGLSAGTDSRRYRLLVNMTQEKDTRISVAAFVWICLNYMRGVRGDFKIDPELKSTVRDIAEHMPSDIMSFVTEYLRVLARKPDAGSGNLVSDLSRMGADMAGRFRIKPEAGMDKILGDVDGIMSDMPPGYMEKMKEFSEAQMRGDDVFAGTIGRMRSFPFFRLLSAWLTPFHLDRSELAPVVDSEGVGMATVLEKMPMLCDSDKYALVLSLAAAPEGLRSSMLTSMCASVSAVRQTEEGAEMMALMEVEMPRGAVMNNYIKNVSRLLRYFPGASGLGIPDDGMCVVPLMSMITELQVPEGYVQFVESVVSLGFPEVAVELYRPVDDAADKDLLCRMARANVMAGKDRDAIALYIRATDAGDDTMETAMELARLMLKDSGYSDNNSEYGERTPVNILEPFADMGAENPAFLRLMAEAYEHGNDCLRSAETYFNLDYVLPPDDMSAKLPLAKVLLKCGDSSEAHSVITPLVESAPTVEVLIVDSLALWRSGKRADAADVLWRAWDMYGGVFSAFRTDAEALSGKLPDLSATGGKDLSLFMLLDMLAYKIYGSRFGTIV